jgi:predicted TPR repeat methyltransferase
MADFQGAEPLLRRAIATDPNLGLAYELLGKLLYRDSRAQEAAAVYRAWLQAAPSDPIAAHLVAATGGGTAPERASDGFVTGLFERAAPDFDTAMAGLGYRAPQLVFESAAWALDPGAVALQVLDLGCGTGLCGEWFRPLARRLVGVDLSPGMIAQARRRGCYDELVCEEISFFIDHCDDRFDLVTAADLFCYFGDLTACFCSVARLLQGDGYFIFSVEDLASVQHAEVEHGTRETAVALLQHGRYAHGLSHIATALAVAALQSVSTRSEILRSERGAPVMGLVVVARSNCSKLPPESTGR